MKERTGPIARPGYRFILMGLIIALLGLWASWLYFFLGVILTIFFVYFFRDPERQVPAEAGVVISPADGRVISLERVREEHFLKQPAQKLSIFMNIFDVHVNRARWPAGCRARYTSQDVIWQLIVRKRRIRMSSWRCT